MKVKTAKLLQGSISVTTGKSNPVIQKWYDQILKSVKASPFRFLFHWAMTFMEYAITISITIIVLKYLVFGFVVHIQDSELFKSRIYGLITYMNDHWKVALFIPPIIFVRVFMQKIAQIRKVGNVEADSSPSQWSL